MARVRRLPNSARTCSGIRAGGHVVVFGRELQQLIPDASSRKICCETGISQFANDLRSKLTLRRIFGGVHDLEPPILVRESGTALSSKDIDSLNLAQISTLKGPDLSFIIYRVVEDFVSGSSSTVDGRRRFGPGTPELRSPQAQLPAEP